MPRGSSRASTTRTSARGRVNQPTTPSSLKSNPPAGSSPHTPIDLTDSAPTAKKRKLAPSEPRRTLAEALQSPPSKKEKKKAQQEPEEKRCRRFRDHAPQSFHDIYERAMSQRFFVLQRVRTGSDECPGETVELTGSTGNIYTVTVGLRPTCDCPHAAKGNQCKHTIFVLKKVLNAPYEYVYQLGLVSAELRVIFAGAPPIEPPTPASEDDNGKRKPIEGDCPICFSELGETKESVVWCRAACGQNMHQECFETWARTRGAGGKVTCPMCRSEWEGEGMQGAGKVEKGRGTVSEGYVNVADQLGISRVRDTSSYSEWFGRDYGGFYGGGYGGYGRRGRGGRGGRGRWRSRW